MHTGENGERHAEVNLSDDATDGATEMEVHGSPSFRPAPVQRSRRTLVFMILGVLLIFVLGQFHLLQFLIATFKSIDGIQF